MVEHRKSFPQAVPNSICPGAKRNKSAQNVVPSRENRSLFRWVEEAMQRFHRPPPTKDNVYPGNSAGETHVGSTVVVDGSLGQHGVVLQLGLAERGGVAGNQNQLGLARSEGCIELFISILHCDVLKISCS